MEQSTLSAVLDAVDERREQRRAFLRHAGSMGAMVAGAGLLAACDDDVDVTPTPPTPTPSPTAPALTDADILNFALNLEYLEASFYSFAATGAGLPADQMTGTGAQGAATGGRQVTFTDPTVAAMARELAADERQHVIYIRNQLGTARIAMPQIDIGTSATGAFSSAARAAGLIGAGASFDPYLNDENFLLAGFIFEDVGVTAYKGAVGLLASRAVIEAAAGIHAAEAYHAGMIRTVLYRKGLTTPALIDSTEAISKARDDLDGASDMDQGIRASGTGAAIASNIVPTDPSGIAYSRSAGQVLNIGYLNRLAVTQGGFFPAGVNGTIRTSAAS
jgi:hypothetical protein